MQTVHLELYQAPDEPIDSALTDEHVQISPGGKLPDGQYAGEEHRKEGIHDTPEKTRQGRGRLLDSATKTFAFRRSKLIQTRDEHGTSFFLQINNVDIFAGGACWIPADSFLRKPDYSQWMELLVESNQIMVRVWGGGIYEFDAFYDACDQHGILVWQDFAFACASYPASDPDFLQSVEIEARQNVARLQRHPSLVIWAGNNEDYQIKEHYDLQYEPTVLDPQKWLQSKFPARFVYESLLPRIVLEEYGVPEGGQAVTYQPGSPYGDARSTTLKVDPTIGDIHQWNVWHGSMKPYQEYPAMGGRFVSEFGMQAYPHFDTLRRTISNENRLGSEGQLWPGSATMDVRNKATGHHFRLLKYVVENFRIRELDNPITFGHITQIMQADAVAHAYRGWRRLWKDRQCGGALIWQLNDCWPTISWSVVDYYGVPKPALYAIKRALSPLAVAVQRNFHDWTTRRAGGVWQRDTGHVEPHLSSLVHYSVWVASSKLTKEKHCRTVVRFISIDTGKDLVPKIEIQHSVLPNTTTALLTNTSVLTEVQEAALQKPKAAATKKQPEKDQQKSVSDAAENEGETESWAFLDHEKLASLRRAAKAARKEEDYQSVTSDDSIAVHARAPNRAPNLETSQKSHFVLQLIDTFQGLASTSSPISDPNPFLPLDGSQPNAFQTAYTPALDQHGVPLYIRRDGKKNYDSVPSTSPERFEMNIEDTDSSSSEDQETVIGPGKPGPSGPLPNTKASSVRTGPSSELLRSLTPCVIFVTLYNGDEDLISTDTSWPDPIKYLEFPNRRVTVNTEMLLPNKLTGTVTVSAERPVKGFVFDEKAGGVTFSDNGFDVMPGEVHLVFLNKKTRESSWPDLEYNYVGKDIWKDEVVEQQKSPIVHQGGNVTQSRAYRGEKGRRYAMQARRNT